MAHARQFLHRCIADTDSRRPRHDKAGLLLQRTQLIIEGIIFQIGHDLRILRVIGLRGTIQELRELLHPDPLLRGDFFPAFRHGLLSSVRFFFNLPERRSPPLCLLTGTSSSGRLFLPLSARPALPPAFRPACFSAAFRPTGFSAAFHPAGIITAPETGKGIQGLKFLSLDPALLTGLQ